MSRHAAGHAGRVEAGARSESARRGDRRALIGSCRAITQSDPPPDGSPAFRLPVARIKYVDVNGDGCEDFAMSGAGATGRAAPPVYLRSGNRFEPVSIRGLPARAFALDLNGDGRVARPSPTTGWSHW